MMNMTQVKKCQFFWLKDKRYFFSNGIFSLPIDHPNLEQVGKFKKDSEEEIENLLLIKKIEMLKLESNAIFNNKKLHILSATLLQPVTFNKLDANKRLLQGKFKKSIYNTTKDYILNSHRMW